MASIFELLTVLSKTLTCFVFNHRKDFDMEKQQVPTLCFQSHTFVKVELPNTH